MTVTEVLTQAQIEAIDEMIEERIAKAFAGVPSTSFYKCPRHGMVSAKDTVERDGQRVCKAVGDCIATVGAVYNRPTWALQ